MLFIWILISSLIILAFYGFVLKKSINYKAVCICLIAAGIPISIFWYFIPTHLHITSINEVNAKVQLHEKYILLSEEEENDLITFLESVKLYRGSQANMMFGDKTNCISLYGPGLGSSSPIHIYILEDRPKLSFAEINGKLYHRRYRIEDPKKIEEYLLNPDRKDDSMQ